MKEEHTDSGILKRSRIEAFCRCGKPITKKLNLVLESKSHYFNVPFQATTTSTKPNRIFGSNIPSSDVYLVIFHKITTVACWSVSQNNDSNKFDSRKIVVKPSSQEVNRFISFQKIIRHSHS
ncbi:hypothetical protein V8G54_006822 [Vigna mungo]|uniref:Uncharacterized protein n=1 Tax=Vigna mungo TaxID=3915 RepID=A0AAQ3P0P5_VIGMU